MIANPLKSRTCKAKSCKAIFTPSRPLQTVCSPGCALSIINDRKEREEAARLKRERQEHRAKAEELKTRAQWLKEAQSAFNAFIRERDRDLPCISCQRYHTGAYDAGHYRSVGAAPQLRFDEDNCHKQCVPCNQYKSGNAIEYRRGLVGRLGVEITQRLEGSNGSIKFSIPQLKEIKATYKAKLRELTQQKEAA